MHDVVILIPESMALPLLLPPNPPPLRPLHTSSSSERRYHVNLSETPSLSFGSAAIFPRKRFLVNAVTRWEGPALRAQGGRGGRKTICRHPQRVVYRFDLFPFCSRSPVCLINVCRNVHATAQIKYPWHGTTPRMLDTTLPRDYKSLKMRFT